MGDEDKIDREADVSRRKLPAAKKRTAHLTVPLSPEERAKVRRRAAAVGLAEATWARVCLLAAPKNGAKNEEVTS